VAKKRSLLHVWRLSKEVTSDDVLAYVKERIPVANTITCDSLNARGDYSSFKLGLCSSIEATLMDPKFWPAGTAIKRFFQQRTKPVEGT
jgi:hypothetical protein